MLLHFCFHIYHPRVRQANNKWCSRVEKMSRDAMPHQSKKCLVMPHQSRIWHGQGTGLPTASGPTGHRMCPFESLQITINLLLFVYLLVCLSLLIVWQTFSYTNTARLETRAFLCSITSIPYCRLTKSFRVFVYHE